MQENKTGNNYFFQGLLMGVFIGAVSALLFAPRSGEETRSQISNQGTTLKQTITGGRGESIPT